MIDPEFIQTIYDETANLFNDSEVKMKGPPETSEEDPLICVVHQKTGKFIGLN